MQTIGYIKDYKSNENILVLVRQASYGRHLKIRRSGDIGTHFSDEEIFLNQEEEYDRLNDLKNGKTIFC